MANEHHNQFNRQDPAQGQVEVSTKSMSKVGRPPTRSIIGFGLVFLFAGIMVYKIFSDDEQTREASAPPTSKQVVSPGALNQKALPGDASFLQQQQSTTDLSKLPPPPALPQSPNASLAAPPPLFGGFSSNSKTQEAEEERRRSGMIMYSDSTASAANAANNLRRIFTEAPSVNATRIGNMTQVIAQGKFIEAVLETGINTDFPGLIRGVVSNDVYSESGKNILIPRGSRLIGAYYAVVQRQQTRVNVIWSRIIRPDGVDIYSSSDGIGAGVDELGKAGIEGEMNNRYNEMFAAAILTSMVSYAAVKILDDQEGDSSNNVSVTVSTDGGSTKQTSATEEAKEDFVDSLSDIGDTIASDIQNIPPTIKVPQGTRLKVFVNKDIHFSPSMAHSVVTIQ